MRSDIPVFRHVGKRMLEFLVAEVLSTLPPASATDKSQPEMRQKKYNHRPRTNRSSWGRCNYSKGNHNMDNPTSQRSPRDNIRSRSNSGSRRGSIEIRREIH